MAWLRIVRPGSVIGPQQQYLKDKEPIMWSLKLSGGAPKDLPQKEPRAKALENGPLTKE
jgi:hypothetical protein